MRNIVAGLAMWLLTAVPAMAKGEVAGNFDYYVLSLSWSANWCTLEGDARKSPQCDEARDHGWILHGLWPQFHLGYPSFCRTAHRPPSRRMTAEMKDIMGTPGLAWHQWKKHGTCSNLSASDYYTLSRRAYEKIMRPELFRKLNRTVKLPATVIEEAFIKANPALEPDGITVTCKNQFIQEVRICLDRDLAPVPCGRDVVKDCKLKDALFKPMR